MRKTYTMTLVGLIFLSILASSVAGISAVGVPQSQQDNTRPLVYGTTSLVVDLDPAYAWDSASIDLIDQVAEGLFAYDLNDPTLKIIPRLAADCGTWNEDGTEFTVKLRENVTFHDGTPFNATAVKWWFDRLNGFIERGETQIAELYEPLASEYPDTPLLINRTEVVDTYTVKFVLNYPYVAFVPLLCFSGSYILSPASTPEDRLLEAGNDTIVGTGPYVYVSNDGNEIRLKAYENYYRGVPAIQEMTWVKYSDANAISQALLAGDIDAGGVLPDYYEQAEINPDVTLEEPMASTVIIYAGMNNKVINKTMRQAISYAVNYTYIIQEILMGYAVRMTSPIPEGILGHADDLNYPVMNVTKARQILVDAGLSKGLTVDSPDSDWQLLADNDPIATYNYTYNLGNNIRENVGVLLRDNLKNIGINLEVKGVSWDEYLPKLLGNFDELEIYMIGWAADYNDPSNFINPLFSNTSLSNGAQVNDPWLQQAMMDALKETDTEKRLQLYHDIQKYIVEDLMPWLMLYVPTTRAAHSAALQDMPRNVMGKLYFFPATWMGVKANITDPLANEDCGFGGAPPEVQSGGLFGAGSIDGFNYIVMLGVAAATVSVMIYRKKRA